MELPQVHNKGGKMEDIKKFFKNDNLEKSQFATYTVHITNENGDIIAIFQGMVYRKKIELTSLI